MSLLTTEMLLLISQALKSYLLSHFLKIFFENIVLSVRNFVLYRVLVHSERLFVRGNHKNELYFRMISFQNEANRVYASDINIVVFKQQS